MTLENSPKLACEKCDYVCSKQSDLLKHFNTIKHKKILTGYEDIADSPKEIICNCGKKYNFQSGLWRHKKKCNAKEEIQTYEKPNLKIYEDNDILLKLLNQNQEFQKLIVEQNKQIMELSSKNCSITNNANNSNSNNNNSNNSFNLNFFLNETCKDAMNIKEFIDSLQVHFQDLEYNGENGYAAGISNIFLRELKQLDVCKRPIHCSDVKREIFHIKNDDGWGKERELLIKCIKQITKKNVILLADWRDAHPGCMNLDNKINDKYNKINCETMGPYLDNEELRCFNKIICNVAKATIIDKHNVSNK
jgi:ribosomal protein S8